MSLSWQRKCELAETALQRAEAGRTRLRSALTEQRQDAEDKLVEQERQLLAAQRQLRELEAGGGGVMNEAQMDALRAHIDELLNEPQHIAAERELEAQNALLASAHTFHVQQQRFQDRLQAELAALHRKERQHEEAEQALQRRLQELTAKLHPASGGSGGAAAASAAAASAAAGAAGATTPTPTGSSSTPAAPSSDAVPPPSPADGGLLSSMLGSVFGEALSRSEQLPAVRCQEVHTRVPGCCPRAHPVHSPH